MNQIDPIERALPRINQDGSITVCAWCYPGKTVFEDYPSLRLCRFISHGICPAHKAQMKAQALALREAA